MGRQYFKVHIEITNICNLQCSFCPEVVRSKKIMSLELFAEIVRQVAPLTRVVSLHLMGDPLVHPQLDKLIEICHGAGLQIALVTNGILLREKEREWLLHPALRQVSFSLHSFPDNFGAKDPTPYLERIFEFTEAAFERRPTLFINYRLWNLASAQGQRSSNLDILAKVEARFGVETGEVDLRVRKGHVIKNRLSLHYDTEFVWPALELSVIGDSGRCHGLTGHFGVLVDGTVVPCCLDKEGVIALGKIPEQPLRDILRGPRAEAMVQGFRNRRLVEELCRRCQFIERFE